MARLSQRTSTPRWITPSYAEPSGVVRSVRADFSCVLRLLQIPSLVFLVSRSGAAGFDRGVSGYRVVP
jgi:hypothetical protein